MFSRFLFPHDRLLLQKRNLSNVLSFSLLSNVHLLHRGETCLMFSLSLVCFTFIFCYRGENYLMFCVYFYLSHVHLLLLRRNLLNIFFFFIRSRVENRKQFDVFFFFILCFHIFSIHIIFHFLLFLTFSYFSFNNISFLTFAFFFLFLFIYIFFTFSFSFFSLHCSSFFFPFISL